MTALQLIEKKKSLYAIKIYSCNLMFLMLQLQVCILQESFIFIRLFSKYIKYA